jgi:glutamate synthase domain-containing protein 1/glutamate synthase domain-containing protein 3
MIATYADKIISARTNLVENLPASSRASEAAEGGCGVLGLAANVPIPGRHTMTAAAQMNNRGNGKGGGIAMAGLIPEQMRVDKATLHSHTLLQIALLDPTARQEVETQFITPHFDIAQAYEIPHLTDYRTVPGLEVQPPDVLRYFIRVKTAVLDQFAAEKGLEALPPRAIEDEFIYQNTFHLNQAFYASLGEKRAFVLCHGRDLIVLKIVGYAEQVVAYYQLEESAAHVWIAHQRYPTKGRVWHPAGAHPFIGLNEALVHNGDFANYHAVGEYLRQRNIAPLFLTDTEVSALLFDLWDRVYKYPLEVTLEAMAPTTEHDFLMLAPEKQQLYQAVQATHMHGSPDGPWFFIVARSNTDAQNVELLGITDTSMLRPQVFALYENTTTNGYRPVQIGLIASERQAINACLRSLSAEDSRFRPLADKYWVARGGSHTDGGAFRFTYNPTSGLQCVNKFGEPVTLPNHHEHFPISHEETAGIVPHFSENWQAVSSEGDPHQSWRWLADRLPALTWPECRWVLDTLANTSVRDEAAWRHSWKTLTLLRDRPVNPGHKKIASLLTLIDSALNHLFTSLPLLADPAGSGLRRLTWETRTVLSSAHVPENGLLVCDTSKFPPEGDESAARWLVKAYQAGWQHIVAYNWRGGRFAGAGLGQNTAGLRLDLYGDVGDYAASGLDGADLYLHGDGQDQLGQIMKSGKLVVYGDVGQTFLYGAKGGEIYVRGSAAGRPLINAVGKPRTVINGTCLDYLAESFMAGDPLEGGGFVIVNGVEIDHQGRIIDLPSPYSGGNLFSLASGGAIYMRDPHHKVSREQLNGGVFTQLSAADWALIEPYLVENARLFGIEIADLLTVDGRPLPPVSVYRKVIVDPQNLLNETENR